MLRFFLLLFFLQFSSLLSAQNLLDNPDHAEYDESNNRYLVSSSLNQAVIAIDIEGNQSYFLSGLGTYVFGIQIGGDTLYVGDHVGRIRAYDLNSGLYLYGIFLPGGHYISGFALDNNGFLYAADNAGDVSKIWKINTVDLSYSIFVGAGLPDFTVDLAYDEPNNRLLVIGVESDSPIFGVNLDDASLSAIVYPPTFERAGITIDNDRNVYFTSWYEGIVYKYDQTYTNPPILVSSGHGTITGCGLGYNHVENILVVPVMSDNRVDFVPLNDGDDDDIIDIYDNCPNEPNFSQLDTDEDGDGDVCDGCPYDFNPGHEDTDMDTIEDACDNCPYHYNPDQVDSNGNDVGDVCDYICGDTDSDRIINILDIVYLINHLYKSGPAPEPMEAADVNHDTLVNILDIVYMINHIYKNGPEPTCM